VDVHVLDRDLLVAFAAVPIRASRRVAYVRESLFAWERLSRRPSNVCSPIIARR
jgi:hypothetical protein